jgi:hypothetical protein
MHSTLTFLLLTVGCAPFAQQDPYYENWNPPTVSELSSTSEAGNIGGGTVVVRGSGFGTDPDQIVVQFGDDNAEILSISDTELEVVVPQGPISGGAVDVRVATKTGTGSADGAYTYDVGSQFDAQVGHVQVNNFWESCLGGMSDRLDDEWGALGCQDIAYIGNTGIDGVAEALTFRYPRLHAENVGFFGGTDQGSSEWVVERPGQIGFVFGVDDLHADIGEVVLRNDLWEGDAWCPTLDDLAVYRYGGGVEGFPDPVSVTTTDVLGGSACDLGDPGAYDISEMHFCSSPTEDGVPSYVYRPDWPVKKNFFRGKKNDWTQTATITLSAPEVGITGTEIEVPESVIVTNTEGFENVVDPTSPAGDIWSVGNLEGCFDDNGDTETLDDVALKFSWERSDVSADDGDRDCLQAGDVCSQYTYVRLTLTQLALNWFGTTSYPVRATLVVDDRHDIDGTTSSVEVPSGVMYQFPTVRLPSASTLGDGLLDSTVGDWGYMVVTFERVTDYTILTESGDTVVFSYTTGDFGFFGWDNPTEADGCHNCLDDDGDGWSDLDDPDCAGGVEELGFGDSACNDGTDNDDDGVRDANDDACDSADDELESDCDNGEDDDGDGLTDELDPGCAAGGNESDDPETGCNDGADNDSDGWTDSEDPDCSSGTDEIGLGSSQCNNGSDDDLDENIDAADLECADAADDDESI